MICKICQQKSYPIFSAKILEKYEIKYYHCRNCHFLQTEEPYWLDEAYYSPINISDTGYVQRNIHLSKKLTILFTLFFNKNEKFLDYAGGCGLFVRIMRDIGFDFYWDDKFSSNLFARGFEHKKKSRYEAVTAFESFEHFADPMEKIESLLRLSSNIIFSTELLPNQIPNPEDWWYYGLDHGQHISFFSKKTLLHIAKEKNLKYYNLGFLHIFTKKNISNVQFKILGFSKLGLHKILQKQLRSKTWDDYLQMSGKHENHV